MCGQRLNNITENYFKMNTNKVDDTILVTTYTLVYNHAPYLRQCLDGLVMQKTNFRFKCFIHDDASTDNSAAIIKEYTEKYPDLFDTVLETENQYSKHDGSLGRIVAEHMKGKYIAMCEGDDYWTDPLKLQKQVDILESNPNISLVYTGFKNIDENGVVIKRDYYDLLCLESPSGDILGDLFKKNYIMTATVVYRRIVYDSQLYQNSPKSYDYAVFLAASILGEIKFLPDKTACYRMNSRSLIVSHKESLRFAFDRIYVYFSKAFLAGAGFKRTYTQRTKIYCDIILGALNNDRRLKQIIKNTRILLLFPFVLIYSYVTRGTSKLKRIINKF